MGFDQEDFREQKRLEMAFSFEFEISLLVAPGARFGHTTTFVGDNRVVLFGGATGDTGMRFF
jgi:hypothetical protein